MIDQLEPGLCYNCGELVLFQVQDVHFIAMLVFLRVSAVYYGVLSYDPH